MMRQQRAMPCASGLISICDQAPKASSGVRDRHRNHPGRSECVDEQYCDGKQGIQNAGQHEVLPGVSNCMQHEAMALHFCDSQKPGNLLMHSEAEGSARSGGGLRKADQSGRAYLSPSIRKQREQCPNPEPRSGEVELRSARSDGLRCGRSASSVRPRTLLSPLLVALTPS